MTISAVVFDLDGTLLDTEKLHTSFWMQAGRENGFDITYEDSLFIRSLAAPLSERYFKDKFGDSFDFVRVRDTRREIMNRYVAKNGIEAKPYAIETLQYLKSRGILTAVATATKKEHMEKYLEMIGADGLLDRMICNSMVKNGKPAPDIYLHVCRELGIEPENCIAVEDAPNGVRSAYDAGCKVVFVPDLTPADDEIKEKAYRIYPSLIGLKELV